MFQGWLVYRRAMNDKHKHNKSNIVGQVRVVDSQRFRIASCSPAPPNTNFPKGKVMRTTFCPSLTLAPASGDLRSSSRPYLGLRPKLGADEPFISDLKPLLAFVQYVYLHTYLFVAHF